MRKPAAENGRGSFPNLYRPEESQAPPPSARAASFRKTGLLPHEPPPSVKPASFRTTLVFAPAAQPAARAAMSLYNSYPIHTQSVRRSQMGASVRMSRNVGGSEAPFEFLSREQSSGPGRFADGHPLGAARLPVQHCIQLLSNMFLGIYDKFLGSGILEDDCL
jgi:hypothetical protein